MSSLHSLRSQYVLAVQYSDTILFLSESPPMHGVLMLSNTQMHKLSIRTYFYLQVYVWA